MANLFRAYPSLTTAKIGYTQTDKIATLDTTVPYTLEAAGKNLGHLTLSAPIALTLTSAAVAPLKANANPIVTLTLTSAVSVMRIGAVDKPIEITSTATARHDRKASLNSSLSLTSTTDVRVTVYGQASNTLNFLNNVTLTARGHVRPTTALLDKPLALKLTAAAHIDTAKFNELIKLTLTAAVTQKAAMRVGVITPTPSVLAVADVPISVGIANLISPRASIDGVANSGSIATGAVIAPISSVSSVAGNNAAISVKLAVVNSVGLTGSVGTSNIANPPVQVDALLSQVPILGGNINVSLPIVSSTVKVGSLTGGIVQNRISSLNGVGLHGSISTGSITLPVTKVAASYFSEITASGNITLTLPIVRGFSFSSVTSFTTWVLTTQTNKASNYTQFPFIALGNFMGKPTGATTDGIYLLTGDDDDGQAIDSVFRFGMADFRSELVGVVDAYIGGDIDSDMELSILEDGQDVENTYTIAKRERHVRGHHTKLGKGFRSQYRQLSISNINGGDFVLNSLTLPSRDLKGNE